ncbi:MAG TPA: glycosyltransferase family 8 protein [Opitutaceae bacterium]|nr:glycosyltransferase family 8 protein [Opitutaceae bacterium]
MTAPITVFTAANEAYAIPLCVCLLGLFRRSSQPLAVTVFDGGIAPRSWRRIEQATAPHRHGGSLRRITPDLSRFAGFPTLRSNHLSYARLFVAESCSAREALYLDSDLLVQADVAALAALPLRGQVVGAVQDPTVLTFAHDRVATLDPAIAANMPYFNAGVLKIDVARWRAEQVQQRCLELIGRNPAQIQYHDQSALNFCLRRRWLALPQTWNTAALYAQEGRPGASFDAAIVHYLGRLKPWEFGHHRGPAAERFFAALDTTPWRRWRPSAFRFRLKTLKSKLRRLLAP